MVGMVKNIEHPKLTFSSPKEEDEHSVTFKGEYPTPFTNLGGAKPCSKVVPWAASWNYTFPFSD